MKMGREGGYVQLRGKSPVTRRLHRGGMGGIVRGGVDGNWMVDEKGGTRFGGDVSRRNGEGGKGGHSGKGGKNKDRVCDESSHDKQGRSIPSKRLLKKEFYIDQPLSPMVRENALRGGKL